jgi:hypothetical protein
MKELKVKGGAHGEHLKKRRVRNVQVKYAGTIAEGISWEQFPCKQHAQIAHGCIKKLSCSYVALTVMMEK